jgi:hypothetical protein
MPAASFALVETIMRSYCGKRLALGVALIGGLSPLIYALSLGAPPTPNPPAAKRDTFKGKVMPLAGLLEKFGSKLDAEVAPHWLALVTDDGKVYPLIEDGNSRLFFRDPRLLNRPMRLGGRLFQDTHLLQVLEVNSVIKGELCEVYYWCEVCSIRRNEKLAQCECCGGPMELKEVPLKK